MINRFSVSSLAKNIAKRNTCSQWRFQSSSTNVPTRNKNFLKINERLPLRFGGELSELEITWEQWGDSTLPEDRTIVIFPSFSHSSHVASNRDDPSPGWWEEIVGPGKAINTSYFRVISASILGSPYGTTSPISINPDTGKQYNGDFPQITPADMAACHEKLLSHLGLNKVHAIVGGSLGGMQALEFAAAFPDKTNRLLVLSCTAQTTPGTVAMRRVQRRAILSDPEYKDGNYDKTKPLEGMKIARELGMTCYRSREEFDARFDWQPRGNPHFKSLTFDVESYMEYQATKFAGIFDPNCYLVLSKAMDLTNLGHGYTCLAEGIGRITADTYVIGVKQDVLTPLSEQRSVVDIMQSYNQRAELEIIDSKFGHDAMFHRQMQANVFSPLIQKFIEKDIEKLLHSEQHRYSSL